jgi:hypothetical protein
MRNKDGFAQKKLLNGLKRHMLPRPRRRFSFSAMTCTRSLPAARAIVKKPPNKEVKREALRLLAADASRRCCSRKCSATRKSCARTGSSRPLH